MAPKAKKKRAKPASSLPTDPATLYALDVVSGRVVAGPHVRDACARHLRDLEHGHKRGLSWDVKSVERVIKFFLTVLTVEVEYTDKLGESQSAAVPFKLEPSQCFIVGSLFGWKRNGLRRFRRAYIEIGKGNGKSPLAAGIGHYMLTATGKLRAEVYCAATDKDQAAIPFRDAVEMWSRSPELERRLIPSGQNPVWQLTLPSTSSFYKPISSEKKGKSGIRPYCALIDEIHEHPDNSVIEMLRAGTKGNREALIFEITNSGFDKNSVCWSEHEYSVRVCRGELENDAWFAYVCGLDESDDPFQDEGCWMKANPLLGVSIHHDFVREQVAEAKGMPSKEAMVRRLHFCQWTEAAEGWMNFKVWEGCEDPELNFEDYAGKECYGGLDLSYTTDPSAVAWVFPVGDGIYDAFVEYWMPKACLAEAEKRDRANYTQWAKDGHIMLTEGMVIKLNPVAQHLQSMADQVSLKGIAYDKYRHKELEREMSDLGIELPMVEHPQGFRRVGTMKDGDGEIIKDDGGKRAENPLWMPNSVQELENAIIEGRLRVKMNPMLRYNVMSVVVRQDPAGTDNKIFDKRKSNARIDGLVALAQAIGLAKARPATGGKSVYETRGVISF